MIEDISEIRESRYRLPAGIAPDVLQNLQPSLSEHGGGFYLRLRSGGYLHCTTGSAVDFLVWPAGITPDQVTDVLNGPVDEQRWETSGANYSWALYEQA